MERSEKNALVWEGTTNAGLSLRDVWNILCADQDFFFFLWMGSENSIVRISNTDMMWRHNNGPNGKGGTWSDSLPGSQWTHVVSMTMHAGSIVDALSYKGLTLYKQYHNKWNGKSRLHSNKCIKYHWGFVMIEVVCVWVCPSLCRCMIQIIIKDTVKYVLCLSEYPTL